MWPESPNTNCPLEAKVCTFSILVNFLTLRKVYNAPTLQTTLLPLQGRHESDRSRLDWTSCCMCVNECVCVYVCLRVQCSLFRHEPT